MSTRILAIESHKIVVTLLSLSSFMYLLHIKLGSMLEKSKSCHHDVTFGCTAFAVDDAGIVITHQATLLTTADLAMAMVDRFTFVALASLATTMHCKPAHRPFYYCIFYWKLQWHLPIISGIGNWQHLIRLLFLLQLLSGLCGLCECMHYHGLLVTFVLSTDVGILFAVTDTSWVVFVKLHMHWWEAISTVIAKVVGFTCSSPLTLFWIMYFGKVFWILSHDRWQHMV